MRRSLRPAAFLGFVLATAPRCDSARAPLAPESATPQAAISGVVRLGDRPIGGASVLLTGPGSPRMAVSGRSGEFAFLGLLPGLYTVTATLTGATCNPSTAEMESGETVTTTIGCTSPQPQVGGTSSISGTVTAGSVPLDGIQVALAGLSFPESEPVERAVVTSPSGGFSFTHIAGGTYVVTAGTIGFACVSPTLAVQANENATADISCIAEAGGGPLPPPPTAPPRGKIAFERAGRILVVDPDGRNGYALIDGLAPSWSEDGRKLVFQRPACLDLSLPPYTNCDDVWRMNADGSGLSPITNFEWVRDLDPVWSPDGSRVAFVRFVHGPDQSYLVVANADPPSALWSEAVLSVWWPYSRPTWSPDGTRLAFTCQGNPPRWELDICVVSSDRNLGYSGSGTHGVDNLLNDTWADSDPAWSPDGARIAFTTNRESTDGRSSVAIIRPDGSGFTRLAAGSRPAWSPDGSRIVFVGEGDATGLHVVNADGSGLVRITDDPADHAPSWGR